MHSLGVVCRYAHTPPLWCGPGKHRYDATNRALTGQSMSLRSDRTVGLVDALIGVRSPKFIHISIHLWRSASCNYKTSTSMFLVRPRPKWQATTSAAEMSTQARIFNSQPKSHMAAARPNASAAPRVRARCSALPVEFWLELHALRPMPPALNTPTLVPTAPTTRPIEMYERADHMLPTRLHPVAMASFGTIWL